MVKTIRPDRAVKCKERFATEETVVKSKLASILYSKDGCEKSKFLEAIRSRVLMFSRRYHIMSIAMNLYIREKFHGVKSRNLNDVEVSEVFEQSFIRQLMLGTETAHQPIEQIKRLYERHPDLLQMLELHERHDGDRNIYSAGGIKYLTNLKNHLAVNLHRWMKRWIYSSKIQDILARVDAFVPPQSRRLICRGLLYDLNGWDLTADMAAALEHLPPRVKRCLQLQKTILGPKPLENKEAFPRMLRYVFFINKFLKKNDPESRQYNVAPVARVRCHYATIDTSALGGITKEMMISPTQDIPKEMWNSLFDIERLQGKKCTFTGTIETDGTAVCVHFKRPKRVTETATASSAVQKKGYFADEDTCVVGLDPGRKDMFHAVVEISPGQFKSVVLSRNQYYREAGIKTHNQKTELWQSSEDMRSVLTSMSQVSTKGNSLRKFQKYMSVWKEAFPMLWTEYTKAKWSEGRFRLYGGKKRVFAEYCNKLEKTVREHVKKEKVVVAYGSAKFAPTGKGEIAVPTSRAYKECQRRFETYVVPEFRTSMVHHKTLSVMQLVGSLATGREIRGLRWCSSTNPENGKCLISRDLNAAINIRNILLWGSQGLPQIFQRGNPPLEKKTGRWLWR
jgi:hypothetical protein